MESKIELFFLFLVCFDHFNPIFCQFIWLLLVRKFHFDHFWLLHLILGYFWFKLYVVENFGVQKCWMSKIFGG